MSRFNTENNNQRIKADDESFDLLKRVNEHLPSYEEEQKIVTKSLETENAEANYVQDKNLIEGNIEANNFQNQKKRVGNSLLSPMNDVHKEVEEEDSDKYISPFSPEFDKKRKEENDEEEEESNKLESNRIQFYIVFALISYILILGIGYHYTSFDDGFPKIVSIEERDAVDYIGNIDGYITSLQNIHSDSIDLIENYTKDIVGQTEFNENIKKSNEKIAKLQEEMKDITPPATYESFQSQLTELYSLQASLNSASVSYAKEKNENTFNLVKKANDKYEESMESFLEKYENLYNK